MKDMETDRRDLEDRAPALFEPDILLASQVVGAQHEDTPERRLLAAVLERALLDAQGRVSPGKPDDMRDALAWFASEDEGVLSFHWVAGRLGIDPDWIRRKLAERRRLPLAA